MKKIYTKEVHYGYITIDDNLSDEEQEKAIREEINNGCEHIDNFEYSFSEKKEELNELTCHQRFNLDICLWMTLKRHLKV